MQRVSSVLIAIEHKISIKNRMDIIQNFLDQIHLSFCHPVTQYHVLMHIFATGMYHSFCVPTVPTPSRVVRPVEEERAVHEICCPGFNWDRVDFLPSVEVWTGVETNFYNTLMFVAK